MKTIRFNTVIGEDRVIRVPADIAIGTGEAEVILLQKPSAQATTVAPETAISRPPLTQRLAALAGQLGISGLPSDLAKNHDHYAHGAPKDIDQK